MVVARQDRLERLDALRGFAAVYVVVHHTLPRVWIVGGVDIGWLWRFGQEAVVLFFLISGFVIRVSVSRAPPSASRWYLARAVRLYAPLLPVLVLGWALASLEAGGPITIDTVELAGNLAMLQDLDWAKPGTLVAPFLDNDPLWSLSYEWWFYVLCLPVFRLPSGDDRDLGAASLAIVGALAYSVWPIFPFRVLFAFGIWWCGVMLADSWLADRTDHVSRWLAPAGLVAVLTLILAIDVGFDAARGTPLQPGLHPVVELRHVFFATVAIGAAWLWSRAAWYGFDRVFGIFTGVAPISYGLYIAHFPLLSDARYLDGFAPPLIRYPVYILVLVATAWVLERHWYPWVKLHVLGSPPPRPQA